MTEYKEGTFTVPVPEDLREFFKSLGYRECKIGLFEGEVKPLEVVSEPSVLKFYERFKHSNNKGIKMFNKKEVDKECQIKGYVRKWTEEDHFAHSVIDFNAMVGSNLKTKYSSFLFECLRIAMMMREDSEERGNDYWIACGSELTSIFQAIPTFDPTGYESDGELRYIGSIQILDFVIHFVNISSFAKKVIVIGYGDNCRKNFVNNLITG